MSGEFLTAEGGYTRHKKTGRYHAIMKIEDEFLISAESFETAEQAVAYLKQWAEDTGNEYNPVH